jgi:isoaspartyl peptidase/L-asparaginase-like protein (Ntn-hydrolase superfamily)
MPHAIIFLPVASKQKELLSRVRDVVAHGAGNVVSNTVAPIMTLTQVRNSLRLKTIMETVVVMNLVSNRKSTVLVGIVDIVDSAGEISFVNIDGY